MKIRFLSFLIPLILCTSLITYAAEPVPFDDFVKITEQALDALDEIETVCSSGHSTKKEAMSAFKKFDTVMKKYDRYTDTTSWPGSVQMNIWIKLTSARLSWQIVLQDITFHERLDVKSRDEAMQITQEVRDKFMEYKNKNSHKKRKKTKK